MGIARAWGGNDSDFGAAGRAETFRLGGSGVLRCPPGPGRYLPVDIFLVGPQFTCRSAARLPFQRQPLRSFAVLIFIQLRQTVVTAFARPISVTATRAAEVRPTALPSSALVKEPQPVAALAGLGKWTVRRRVLSAASEANSKSRASFLPGRQLPPVPRPPPDGCPERQAPEGRESYGCPFVLLIPLPWRHRPPAGWRPQSPSSRRPFRLFQTAYIMTDIGTPPGLCR